MGRHREFKEEVALDAALAVFWEKGYEGTSFDDLTRATNVARPGLYAAFGNKESLFFKALDRYGSTQMTFMQEAMNEPTSLDVVTRILRGTVDLSTRSKAHSGCLGVNGAIACSSDAEPVRLELVRRRSLSEAALVRRLKRAQKEEDLPLTVKPEMLAKLVMTITQGISVQAKAGISRAALHEMIEQFLQTWPAKTAKPLSTQRAKTARAK